MENRVLSPTQSCGPSVRRIEGRRSFHLEDFKGLTNRECDVHNIFKKVKNYSRRNLQVRVTRLLPISITTLSLTLTHSHLRNSHTNRIANPQVLAVVSDCWVPRVQLRKSVVVLRFNLRARVATGNSVIRITVRCDA